MHSENSENYTEVMCVAKGVICEAPTPVDNENCKSSKRKRTSSNSTENSTHSKLKRKKVERFVIDYAHKNWMGFSTGTDRIDSTSLHSLLIKANAKPTGHAKILLTRDAKRRCRKIAKKYKRKWKTNINKYINIKSILISS